MACTIYGESFVKLYILAADGVVHRVPMQFEEKALLALITPAGGEPMSFADLVVRKK
jgi:hypothetical protein